jgi:molybdate transport system substrate-binding protein
VRFSFAGSTALVAQLTAGAPADVFAAADEATMGAVVEAGLVYVTDAEDAGDKVTAVAIPESGQAENSYPIALLGESRVVLCAPQVPCGAASVELEKVTGVSLTPISEESTVTDVLGKITAGQADAGLVYVTDAEDAGDKVTAVAIPESGQAENSYPIALLGESRNLTGAKLFVEMVTGPIGRKALAGAGFTVP